MTLWWLSIGLGIVVLLVVAVLLIFVLSLLGTLARQADDLAATARTAHPTTAAAQLGEVAAAAHRLRTTTEPGGAR